MVAQSHRRIQDSPQSIEIRNMIYILPPTPERNSPNRTMPSPTHPTTKCQHRNMWTSNCCNSTINHWNTGRLVLTNVLAST